MWTERKNNVYRIIVILGSEKNKGPASSVKKEKRECLTEKKKGGEKTAHLSKLEKPRGLRKERTHREKQRGEGERG